MDSPDESNAGELNRVLNRVTDAIYAIDNEWRFTYVNDRAESLLGHAEEELRGEALWDVFPEAVDSPLHDQFREAMETQEPVSFERYSEPLDIWAEVQAYPSETGLSVYFRDVTEQKRVEAELRRERNLTDQIVETSPMGIAVVDANGEITFINERAEEIYDRSREEIGDFSHDDPRWDLVDENGEPLETGQAPFDRVLAREESIYDQVIGLRRPSGERVWVSVNGAPQWNEAGELERAVFAFEDVTERRETQRQLEESERRYRTLAENFPNGAVGMYDDELRYSLVEGGIWDEIEPDAEDLEGNVITNALPSPAAEDLEQLFRTALNEGEIQSVQTEFVGRTWRVWGTPLRDADGETFAGLSFSLDITEQIERERELDETITELQESEERLQLALEAGEMGTWELDLQTEDSPVHSPQHNRIFGYEEPLEDWDFDTFLDHVHPGDREKVKQRFEEAFETGKWEFECRITRADGERRVISAQGEFYFDSEGEPVRAVGVVQDVTDRKERERELERALDLLERTERIADVGGWEIDPETKEVFWTDHIFDLLEVPGDEEPPLDEALDMYHEEDKPIVESAVEEALASGDSFDVEVRLRTAASDEVRWLRLQGVPETVDGDVVSFRGAAQDVTERKQREQRLEELIDRLEESNERLEQFAYAASHDLQEPLRMVSSYLQLIEGRYSDALDEDGEEFLEFAVDGADRMRNMIEALLQYSRVETQGDDFEPVDLDTVVTDVRDDLQVRIEETDAEITAGSLPRVDGDEEQLRQVFQNLLDNAIEYSGDEPPRVDISAERSGAAWVVSVSDEGIGIEPDDADRIFEVFQRLHTNDDHSGTGIGLALCERIVERHGGDIWIESEPDEGSTFSFTLPAASDSGA